MQYKKDFELYADLISVMCFMKQIGKEFTIEDIENHIKAVLKKENPKFDNEKWDNYIMKQVIKLLKERSDKKRNYKWGGKSN